MKKTLAVRVFESMLVLCENKTTPSDADWDAFLAILSDHWHNFHKLKILVMTDGGGPDTAQRKRLEKALNGKPVRVAVVTDSAKVRFIASAIALLNREHHGFSKSELTKAYEHLGMTPSEQRLAERALKEMASEIA